jgi:hypothetical protein
VRDGLKAPDFLHAPVARMSRRTPHRPISLRMGAPSGP